MTTLGKKILKIVISAAIAILTAIGAGLGLNSCKVARDITCKCEYVNKGDSAIVIQSKTTETYNAAKKMLR